MMTVNILPQYLNVLKCCRLKNFGKPRTLKSSAEFYGLLVTVVWYNHLCIKSNIMWWSHTPTMFCVKLHFLSSVRMLEECAMQVDHSIFHNWPVRL